MPSADTLVRQAAEAFRASPFLEYPGDRDAEARELLGLALGRQVSEDEDIRGPSRRRFERLVARRAAGEPMAYLQGGIEFRGLTLSVRPGAFIPRPSTEFLAEQAIRRVRSRHAPVILDLGTGIGPVALALAREVGHSQVYGIDIAPMAIAVARRNAGDLGVENVKFLTGDLFSPLPRSLEGRIDVITLHPPYAARWEMRWIAYELKQYEPREAVTDESKTGLRLVTRTAEEARRWLKSRGWLLVQVNVDRARRVAAILRSVGYSEVRSRRQPRDISRVIVGRAP